MQTDDPLQTRFTTPPLCDSLGSDFVSFLTRKKKDAPMLELSTDRSISVGISARAPLAPSKGYGHNLTASRMYLVS